MAWYRRTLMLSCVALAVAQGEDANADTASTTVRLEAGSEYDSNVHRLEVADGDSIVVTESPLFRGAARLNSVRSIGPKTKARVAALMGGKLFVESDAQRENVGIVSVDGRLERTIASRRAVARIRTAAYESFSLDPVGGAGESLGRNFATRVGEAALVLLGASDHRATLSAGLRNFEYKPDADFDWSGEHYGLRYQMTAWRGNPDLDLDAASLDVDVAYELGRRRYAGRAFANNCAAGMDPDPRCIVPTSFERADLVHTLRGQALYTGERIWSAAYELQLADSNSFGQSLLRQRVDLGVTAETWAGIFVSAKVALILNVFLDPLLLSRDVQAQTFITIDDENRNSFSVHLARDIGDRWSAEARYAIYTNEFATQELRFRRQIAYLGLTYAYH